MARPTNYTPELGDLICEGIARKTPLARLCDENDELPCARTVYYWLRAHDEFLQNYTRAKDDQADYLAEETLEIADDPDLDANDKRVRIDTRKWLASKLKPKKYGDKMDLNHGGQKDNPLKLLLAEISGNVLDPDYEE